MGKYTLPRSGYTPAGAQKVTRDGIDAEVYLYETSKGKPGAVMFGGKRSKPDKNFYYLSVERRDQAVEDYFNDAKASAEYKSKRKAEQNSFIHSLKVGNILRNSWGYDQTNVDFYQVIELVGKKSVRIRPISCSYTETGFMSGESMANPGHFIGKAILKRVSDGNSVKIHSWGSYAYLWNGKPAYTSSYA